MEKKKWYDKIWDWLKGDIKSKPIKSDEESKGLTAKFTLCDESIINKNKRDYSSLWTNEYSNPLLIGGYTNQGSYAGSFSLNEFEMSGRTCIQSIGIFMEGCQPPIDPIFPSIDDIPLSINKENIEVVHIFHFEIEGDIIVIKDIRYGTFYHITKETFLSLILKPKYPYIKTIKSI